MHVNVGLWLISGQRGDKQGSSLLSQLVPEMSIGVDGNPFWQKYLKSSSKIQYALELAFASFHSNERSILTFKQAGKHLGFQDKICLVNQVF